MQYGNALRTAAAAPRLAPQEADNDESGKL